MRATIRLYIAYSKGADMTDNKKKPDSLLMRRLTPDQYILLQDEIAATVADLTERGLPLTSPELAEKSIAAEELYIEFMQQLPTYIQSLSRSNRRHRTKHED